jgi:hypothetical protein
MASSLPKSVTAPQPPHWFAKTLGLFGLRRLAHRVDAYYKNRKLNLNWAQKNASAHRALCAQPPVLDDVQRRLVSDLQLKGFAYVPFTELFSDPRTWTGLEEEVQTWLANPDIRTKETQYQTVGFRSAEWKEYIIRRFGRGAVFSWDNPFLRVGLEEKVLSVANTYLGLMSRLLYVDVWNTLALEHSGPDIGSQRWHRDPEDRRLVKAFLYFTDVDETSGPLQYVPHSRKGEKYGHLWPQQWPKGSVPPPEEFQAAIPKEAWQMFAFPKGTLLFVDTSGFHRGGRATKSRRVLATWTFTSHATEWPQSFQVDGAVPMPDLSLPVRFALYGGGDATSGSTAASGAAA